MRLAWYLFALLVVALILGPLLAGCTSPLPPCERYDYQIAENDEGEQFVVLDMENAERLMGLIRGIAEGKCRLPSSGTET